jgi:hypothetical protein
LRHFTVYFSVIFSTAVNVLTCQPWKSKHNLFTKILWLLNFLVIALWPSCCLTSMSVLAKEKLGLQINLTSNRKTTVYSVGVRSCSFLLAYISWLHGFLNQNFKVINNLKKVYFTK